MRSLKCVLQAPFLVLILVYLVVADTFAEGKGKIPAHLILAECLSSFDVILYPHTGAEEVVYGDERGYLHFLGKGYNGSFSEKWKTLSLGGAIGGVFSEDLDLDGNPEVLAYSANGKIVVINPVSSETIWSNDQFGSITAMALGNVDDDPQPEIVFYDGSDIYIYDAKTRFEEWKGQEDFGDVRSILIRDLDGDGQMEIAFNTGYVLDSRFYDVEWESAVPFGEEIKAFDVDGDGVEDLIGEFQGRFVKVFDVRLRREKW